MAGVVPAESQGVCQRSALVSEDASKIAQDIARDCTPGDRIMVAFPYGEPDAIKSQDVSARVCDPRYPVERGTSPSLLAKTGQMGFIACLYAPAG